MEHDLLRISHELVEWLTKKGLHEGQAIAVVHMALTGLVCMGDEPTATAQVLNKLLLKTAMIQENDDGAATRQ